MRNKGRKEVVISSGKFKSNIKKFWYIIAIMCLLGIVMSAVKAKQSLNTHEVIQEDNKEVKTCCYGANVMVKEQATADTMKNIVVFANGNDVIKQLNEGLKSAGYSEINSSDYLAVSVYSGSYLHVAAYGVNDYNRVKKIVELWADLIVNLSEEKFQVPSAYVDGEISVFNAIQLGVGSYVKSMGALEEPGVQNKETVATAPSIGKKDVIKAMISIKSIIIIAVAIIGGFAIIFILALLDSTVYTRFEIEQLGTMKYLGDVRKDKHKDVILAGIASIVKEYKYESLMIASVKGDCTDKLTEYKNELQSISKELDIKVCAGISDNSSTISAMKDSDAVIMFINSGTDRSADIEAAIDEFDITGANLMGYIIR